LLLPPALAPSAAMTKPCTIKFGFTRADTHFQPCLSRRGGGSGGARRQRRRRSILRLPLSETSLFLALAFSLTPFSTSLHLQAMGEEMICAYKVVAAV
jgi:hypothetical protein